MKHSKLALLLLYTSIIGAVNLLFSSCYTLRPTTIDVMMAGHYGYFKGARRMAIVNNLSTSYDALVEQDTTKVAGEISRKEQSLQGDAQVFIQALAKTLTEQQYLNKVVAYDKPLRDKDSVVSAPLLTRPEISYLTKLLDVDILLSLEDIQMRIARIATKKSRRDHTSLIRGRSAILLALYTVDNQKKQPYGVISGRDSMSWQTDLPDEAIIHQVSEQMGVLGAHLLFPSLWKVGRYYFAGKTGNFSRATHAIERMDWDEAAQRWQKVWDKHARHNKKRLFAAFNLALYHESNSKFSSAYRFLDAAQQMADELQLKDRFAIIDNNGAAKTFNMSELIRYVTAQVEIHEAQNEMVERAIKMLD